MSTKPSLRVMLEPPPCARHAFTALAAAAALGLGFSGFLSYRELFGSRAEACSPVGTPGTLLGYPPCVYGLFMYFIIVIVAGAALRQAGRARRATAAEENCSSHRSEALGHGQ